jgi:hypothetical protein
MTQLQKSKQIIVSSDIPHPCPELFPKNDMPDLSQMMHTSGVLVLYYLGRINTHRKAIRTRCQILFFHC